MVAVGFIAVALASSCLTGCHDTNELPVELGTAVSPAETAETEALVKDFSAKLQGKQFDNATKMLTHSAREKLPSTKAAWTASAFAPLANVKEWQFKSLQHAGKSRTIILHASFTTTTGKLYRTNVDVITSGNTPMIDMILIPTEPVVPVSTSASTAAMPGK